MSVVFNHIGLCVSDTGRSRRFYEEVFEFRFWWELDPEDEGTGSLLGLTGPIGLHATYLVRDGLVLELLDYKGREVRGGPARTMDELGLTHISLSVPDFDSTFSRVREFGGMVLEETVSNAAAMVRDPDGQLLEILTDAWRGFLPPQPS